MNSDRRPTPGRSPRGAERCRPGRVASPNAATAATTAKRRCTATVNSASAGRRDARTRRRRRTARARPRRGPASGGATTAGRRRSARRRGRANDQPSGGSSVLLDAAEQSAPTEQREQEERAVDDPVAARAPRAGSVGFGAGTSTSGSIATSVGSRGAPEHRLEVDRGIDQGLPATALRRNRRGPRRHATLGA